MASHSFTNSADAPSGSWAAVTTMGTPNTSNRVSRYAKPNRARCHATRLQHHAMAFRAACSMRRNSEAAPPPVPAANRCMPVPFGHGARLARRTRWADWSGCAARDPRGPMRQRRRRAGIAAGPRGRAGLDAHRADGQVRNDAEVDSALARRGPWPPRGHPDLIRRTDPAPGPRHCALRGTSRSMPEQPIRRCREGSPRASRALPSDPTAPKQGGSSPEEDKSIEPRSAQPPDQPRTGALSTRGGPHRPGAAGTSRPRERSVASTAGRRRADAKGVDARA